MAGGRNPLKQVGLPFAEGEGSHAERWNDLGIALLRIPPRQCTAQLAGLVRWIFNVTKGGVTGSLTKSFSELAQRPWGLCCDERTVRRTVSTAQRYGLIAIEEQRRWDGGQQPNAYRIDWAGVAALKNGCRTDGHGVQGGGHGVHPPGHTVHPGGHGVRHIRNDSLLQSSSRNSGTGTGTGAGPNPRTDSTGQEPSALAAALLDNSPILLAARGRRIVPKPAGSLTHGIFRPLQGRDLADTRRMVSWFRQQLSTAVPATGDTEADLLLVLATALYATSLPASEVKKSRVGVFVFTLTRKLWMRSVPFVPQARVLLDNAIEEFGAAWAGLAEETATAADATKTLEVEA